MPSFRRQFTTSGHNLFRGKGKGKSVVKGLFMRDVILLTGPDIKAGEESVVNGERPCDFWFSVAKRVVRVCA